MPKGPRGEKRPADAIGLAVMVGKIATGEIDDTVVAPSPTSPAKTEAARKGGKARTKVVSPTRRTEIARNAATARWKGDKAPTD
jgi:hypothetical protein